MRLLHFADLHLGIENYGTLDTRTGLSSRVRDFLRSFDEVVDYAVSKKVDAVLFAGDAFKNRDPNPTVQRDFARRVRRLAETNIPTVLLIGNHDLPTVDARATAIDIYEILNIPGVFVARHPDLLTIATASGPLQVVTLPWMSRVRLLGPEKVRAAAPEELSRIVSESISAILGELAQQIDPAMPAVLLAHLSIEGARLGSEQSIMLGQDLVLDTDELHVRAFDYVALGHIHQHQQITARPPTVYAGSLERIDFGEEKEDKGFVIIEICDGPRGERETSFVFHPVHARRFLTLRVTARHEDPMEDVRLEVERHADEIDGAVVRAYIALAPEREELLRPEDVRRSLVEAGAAYVSKVVRDVELQARPRVDLREHEALDPVTMLQTWLTLRDLSDEQRARILEHGKALIQADRAVE